MTMPNERTRALRFGRDALELMAQDSAFDDTVRARAREILDTYPAQDEVLGWIGADVRILPQRVVQALSATSELLFRVGILRRASGETARTIEFARRHYPDRQDCEEWSIEQRFRTIRHWLLPENYFDKPEVVASHRALSPTDAWVVRGINGLARLTQLDELERQAGTRPKD